MYPAAGRRPATNEFVASGRGSGLGRKSHRVVWIERRKSRPGFHPHVDARLGAAHALVRKHQTDAAIPVASISDSTRGSIGPSGTGGADAVTPSGRVSRRSTSKTVRRFRSGIACGSSSVSAARYVSSSGTTRSA